MEEKDKYKSISCGFYDELILLAMHQKRSKLTLLINAQKSEVEVIIKDIFTRKGEEFLLTTEGKEIRLDKIIQVDS